MPPGLTPGAGRGGRKPAQIRDFGHLDLEMTFDDPAMYTRPFTVRILHELVPDNDIFEMFCNQNEKDRPHMVK